MSEVPFDPGNDESAKPGEDSREGSFARQLREHAAGGADIFKPGDTLDGRYLIHGVLGRGGMGVVYEATRKIMPERRLAVKTLHHHPSGKISTDIIREARNAMAIRHPNVVTIADVALLPDGSPYLVMEYIGPDLAEYAKKLGGTLPAALALEFCAQVCDALAAAHEKRIVHRDIKPGNCLVRSEKEGDYIVVSDFGLARALHGEDSTHSEWTITGSKGYMAPEIFSGQPPPDERVDIFSVGAMLFRLIWGSTPPLDPFSPTNPASGEYRGSIPQSVISILRICLAVEPAQRYGSARELGAEIRRAQVSLRAPLALSGARPSSRSKAKLAIFSMSLLGVMGIILLLVHFSPSGESQTATIPDDSAFEALSPPAVSLEPQAPELKTSPGPIHTGGPNLQVTAVQPGGPKPETNKLKRSTMRPSGSRRVAPVEGLPPIDEAQAFLDRVCADISLNCAEDSFTKQTEEMYRSPGSLKAELTMMLPSASNDPIFKTFGILSNDGRFQQCARERLAKAVKKQRLKEDLGARTCTVRM